MKNLSTIALLALVYVAIPLTSAISLKNHLRMSVSGTITQSPDNGDIIILKHKSTGRCLDMDTDGGIHLRSCKDETDEKWKFIKESSSYYL